MAPIAVSVEDLYGAADELTNASWLTHELERRSRSRQQALAKGGHAELAEAADEFFGAWASGMRALAEDSSVLALLLVHAARVYAETERCIAGAAASRPAGPDE